MRDSIISQLEKSPFFNQLKETWLKKALKKKTLPRNKSVQGALASQLTGSQNLSEPQSQKNKIKTAIIIPFPKQVEKEQSINPFIS